MLLFALIYNMQIVCTYFSDAAILQYGLSQGPVFDLLQRELETWRRNYLDVISTGQQIYELKSRNQELRAEIDRLVWSTIKAPHLSSALSTV